MASAKDRDALYYPYIHIRDVNWLKASLLSFPQVRRIAPSYFAFRDTPEILQFRELKGPRGEPLLVEEEPHQYSVYQASQKLGGKLAAYLTDLRGRYSHEKTVSEFGDRANDYQIFEGKMDDVLIELESAGLAWKPVTQEPWYALHPKLGQALMTTIALAIAADKGLDIITDATDVHHKLAASDQDAAFEGLLREDLPGRLDHNPTGPDDIAQLVMTTKFDLSRLTPEQVVELLKDGKDLRAFKNALVPLASELPAISDPEERRKRVKLLADRVIEEWQSYKKSLPRFALEALLDAKDVKIPDLVPGMIVAGTTWTLGAALGITIGMLTYSGMKIWRRYRDNTASPFHYLSRISTAGASLAVT